MIGINRRRVFSLEDARAVLPVVFRITKEYARRVDGLVSRLESRDSLREDLIDAIESQISQLVLEWQGKLQKLGALPKGLWLADFDSGDGYYCWKYPERTVEFWHSYNDGYSRRVQAEKKPTHASTDKTATADVTAPASGQSKSHRMPPRRFPETSPYLRPTELSE